MSLVCSSPVSSPGCIQAVALPDEVWAKVDHYRETPVLFYGAVSYHGFPKYAEVAWESADESIQQQWMEQAVLREFLKTGDEMERTYSNAFFMTQGIDLRLE